MQYFSEKINSTYNNTSSKTIYFNSYVLIIKIKYNEIYLVI